MLGKVADESGLVIGQQCRVRPKSRRDVGYVPNVPIPERFEPVENALHDVCRIRHPCDFNPHPLGTPRQTP